MRFWWLGGWCVFLAVGWVARAGAFDAGLTVGLGQWCAANAPAPVHLWLDGGEEDFEGTLRVLFTGEGSGREGELLRHEQSLFLPARNRRHLHLTLVPGETSGFWAATPDLSGKASVQLLRGRKVVWMSRGDALAFQCPLLRQEDLVVTLDGERAWLRWLEHLSYAGSPTPPGTQGLHVATVAPRSFTLGDHLSAARLVVVAPQGHWPFQRAQEEALEDYVRRGGALLLGAGIPREVLAKPWGQRLLGTGGAVTRTVPFDDAHPPGRQPEGFTSSEQAVLLGLTHWNHPSLVPLVYWGREPLLSHHRVGAGDVYWLSAVPNRPPFLGSDAEAAVFRHLLAPPPRQHLARFPPWTLPQQERLTVSNTAPWMPLYLLFFVVAMGPLQWLVLRRSTNPSFAWVTLPTITGAFVMGGLLLHAFWPGAPAHLAGEVHLLGSTGQPRWDAVFRGHAVNHRPRRRTIAFADVARARLFQGFFNTPPVLREHRAVLPGRHGWLSLAASGTAAAPIQASVALEGEQWWLSLHNHSAFTLLRPTTIWPGGQMVTPESPRKGFGTITLDPGEQGRFPLAVARITPEDPPLSRVLPTDSPATQFAVHYLDDHTVALRVELNGLVLPEGMDGQGWRPEGLTVATVLLPLDRSLVFDRDGARRLRTHGAMDVLWPSKTDPRNHTGNNDQLYLGGASMVVAPDQARWAAERVFPQTVNRAPCVRADAQPRFGVYDPLRNIVTVACLGGDWPEDAYLFQDQHLRVIKSPAPEQGTPDASP